MKLSPQQEKIFNTIKALRIDFSQALKTDKEKAGLIGNAIITKCDYLLELYKDQEAEKDRLLSVNDYCIKKQNEYEIISFIDETKDFITNFLGGKNESN